MEGLTVLLNFLKRDRIVMEHIAELGELPNLNDVIRSSLSVATDLLSLTSGQKVMGRAPDGNREGLYLGPGVIPLGEKKKSDYTLDFEPNTDDSFRLETLKASAFADNDSWVVRRSIQLLYEVLSNLRSGWTYSVDTSQLRLKKTDGVYHAVID